MKKILELRQLEEPVTVVNIATRFGISERLVYYVLADQAQPDAGGIGV